MWMRMGVLLTTIGAVATLAGLSAVDVLGHQARHFEQPMVLANVNQPLVESHECDRSLLPKGDTPAAWHGVWQGIDTSDSRFTDLYFHPDGTGFVRHGDHERMRTRMFDWSATDGHVYVLQRSDCQLFDLPWRNVATKPKESTRMFISSTLWPDEGVTHFNQLKAQPKDAENFCFSSPFDRKVTGCSDNTGRLWLNEITDRFGRTSFEMYQFKKSAVQNAGPGWFHQGNVDAWQTEKLAYRAKGCSMELDLDFSGTKEHEKTRIALHGKKGLRTLRIENDPRFAGEKRTFREIGTSWVEAFHGPLAEKN